MHTPPTLGRFELDFSQRNGFKLCSFQDVFSEETYRTLQRAFRKVDWEEKITFFYSQYKSHVLPTHKHALSGLFDPAFFFPFKAKLEQNLKVSLQNKIRIMAHRLITSHEIGVHNDYSDPALGGENFRFIFQFAENRQLISGGELSFLASRYTGEVIKQYSYSANTGICFEITPHSHHSVAAVEGERHTLVMYLWETGRKYNDTGVEIRDLHEGTPPDL